MGNDADRPTVFPAFDMEEYARESDQRIRAARPVQDSSGSVSRVQAREELVETSTDVEDADAEQVYWACLGGPDHVPVLVRPHDEMLTVRRSGAESFVVSYVDGRRTVAAVIEASGLPVLAALDALQELLERGVIALRDPGP